jgi:thiamine-monophosphate kinase
MSDTRGEFAYINWIRSRLPTGGEGVTIGPGDDMAELRVPVVGQGDARVLIGTDTILDGVHFDTSRDALADIGWKALAVNLSDVAAMAGCPLAAVGAVALPRAMPADEARDLFEGLRRCAEAFDCHWVGGDVTAWDKPLAITVTVLAHAENPVRRNGAKCGQLVCVTGELGGSLAGRHLTFRPRVAEARQLAEAVTLGAMIDLSDGLSSDVGHICDESDVGVEIDLASVPVAAAARELADGDERGALVRALSDGEDFELLFTVDAADADAVRSLDLGVPVAVVGRIVPAADGRTLIDADGRRSVITSGGYEHWR